MNKPLTIAQAHRELVALLDKRLTQSPQDLFLRTRLQQYMDAIERAISDLQAQQKTQTPRVPSE